MRSNGALLVLPHEIVDRARVFAGEARSPSSCPSAFRSFRALIEEGLKRGGHRTLLARVASEATAMHQRWSHADRTPAGRRQPSRREQPTARKWERGRSDAVVKLVAATAWAMVAAVTLGCAQPTPAVTAPAAPALAGVATGEAAGESVTPRVETSHASEEARREVTAFYLYLLSRSR